MNIDDLFALIGGAGSGVSIAFAILVLITLFKGIRTVPQGSVMLVQRLGKYNRMLSPGLNLIIPYIENVAYVVTTRDIVIDIPSQEVITRDNAVLLANAVAYINIISPAKAIYGVEDYQRAIQTLVQTSLRAIIGEMNLDDALSSRDEIKIKLKESIADNMDDWGITLKTVEIQDINPSPTMQKAMEEQAAAERARRATVSRAEGDKAAAILQADGELEASRRMAEANIVLADASREAIVKVTQALGERELPALYLLGEKYIASLEEVAKAENTTTLVLPADLTAAVRGLFHPSK